MKPARPRWDPRGCQKLGTSTGTPNIPLCTKAGRGGAEPGSMTIWRPSAVCLSVSILVSIDFPFFHRRRSFKNELFPRNLCHAQKKTLHSRPHVCWPLKSFHTLTKRFGLEMDFRSKQEVKKFQVKMWKWVTTRYLRNGLIEFVLWFPRLDDRWDDWLFSYFMHLIPKPFWLLCFVGLIAWMCFVVFVKREGLSDMVRGLWEGTPWNNGFCERRHVDFGSAESG